MDSRYLRSRIAEKLDDYAAIGEYMREVKRIDYLKFDYDVTHGLPLFVLDPDFDFVELERRTDAVMNALPAIKRIFDKPYIHLIERDVVMPIEAVRVVNNDTLMHIATHSELWSNVRDDEITPDKLLTRTYEDNYGIYENLVFCDTVDDVLSFARRNERFLQQLIYTDRAIKVNLLERVNHLDYFLALGKLHIGYGKAFDAHAAEALRCHAKLRTVLSAVTSRLKKPVYRLNKRRPNGIKLRKTNIFAGNKDYHRVYMLAESFAGRRKTVEAEISDADVNEFAERYRFYCRALCVFAAAHFGFDCDVHKSFDFSHTLPDFKFKAWELHFTVDTPRGCPPYIVATVDKDFPYTTVIVPTVDAEATDALAAVRAQIRAEAYVAVSPFEDCDGAEHIDISSIESFRRLQRTILRGMVYSDAARDDCPFCSHSLERDDCPGGETMYVCRACGTRVREAKCKTTGEAYYYTDIAGLKEPNASAISADGGMYYRNITDIDADGVPICPICGEHPAHG